MAPIYRLENKSLKTYFSYDLSAATDRLPIAIQRALLEPLLGSDLASTWVRLLVERDYRLSRAGFKTELLRYAVGQPMGALSSWAMLALTHHALVQFAYFRSVGKRSDRAWASPSKG